MILTFKYRIKDRSARKALSDHARACNQVWNWCVAQQLDTQARYRAGAPKRKWLTHFDLVRQCKGAGALLGIHQQTVEDVCRQFVHSRNNIGHATRFRASFGAHRARGWIPFRKQSRQIKANSVTYLGKTYRFFGTKRRALPHLAGGGHFVEDALGRWYVCFRIEAGDRSGLSNGKSIGVDLGLKTFAALSDGRKIVAPRHFRRLEAKLCTAQRAGNSRRAKALHGAIKNSRRDFLHKLSTQLARDHAIIAVGNVSAKRLARTRMAKSALDAGWSTLRQQLAYKSAGYIDVDEKFTTQTCSCCGSADSDKRPKGIAGLGMRFWECSRCGSSHDRDVNAARNILKIALSAQRRGDESRLAAG